MDSESSGESPRRIFEFPTGREVECLGPRLAWIQMVKKQFESNECRSTFATADTTQLSKCHEIRMRHTPLRAKYLETGEERIRNDAGASNLGLTKTIEASR